MSAAPDLMLLAELRAAGFDVRRADRDRSRLSVTPGGNLTETQKARITTGKSALIAALDAEGRLWRDLDRRIRKMGERWGYSPEDLTEALGASRMNPAGWLLALECDEERAECFRRAGMRYPISSRKHDQC